MNPIDLLYCVGGVIAHGFIFHGVTDWFSQDARITRKRRRNRRMRARRRFLGEEQSDVLYR